MTIDPIKARELMEKAIEAMRQTVHEPRKDGKISPLVGVAILKPDGKVETACRGELRHGDHAEYTLLERKNNNNKLDNSTLFTTLEPCAPGSREPPKLSCSERIVKARIKEVWIGIEDPDPTVSHKGIIYLQENGVIVRIFPPDLQEIICQVNKKFLELALVRKEEASIAKEPKKAILSAFEDANGRANFQDLSIEALNKYRIKTNIPDVVESQSFKRRLIQQGLIVETNGEYKPTGYSFLLFGNRPRDVFPQAGLLGTIHYPSGAEETRDFNYPLILIPALVEEWLKNKMPTILDRNQMMSEELLDRFPYIIIREAVVNALIHRDYDIAGAKCQFIVNEHMITIKSPGTPRSPITIEQMQAFNAPMLSRNPMLHYVFQQMGNAEERGLGLLSIKSAAEKYHLPLPKYTFEDPYLILTIYTSQESAVEILSPEIRKSLNADEIKGWRLIASKTTISKSEYAELMGFKLRKAQRHLSKFVELNLLSRIGEGPSTKYQVIRQ